MTLSLSFFINIVHLHSEENENGENPLAYDAGDVEKVDLPNDTYLTLGIALMAFSFSFSGCLKGSLSQTPAWVFAGGSSVFLFRQVTIKEDYERDSEALGPKIKKWEKEDEAYQQIRYYKQAAQQEELAAEAAEKKASNARFLEKSLYISSGLFLAFPFIKCKGCLIGYFPCLGTYNSCDGGLPIKCASVAPTRNTPFYSLLHLLSIPSAHAFNAKKLGIVGLGAVLGTSKILGNRLSSIPDIFKGAMMMALAKVASNAAKEWDKAAVEYRKRKKSYKHLADAVEAAIEKETGVTGGPSITATQYPSPVNATKSTPEGTSPKVSPCAVGKLGELTIDRTCACKKTNTCTNVPLPKIAFDAFDAPPSFGQAYDSYGQELNGAFSGDPLQSGQTASSSFLSKAAKVKDWPNDLLKNIKKEFEAHQPGSFDQGKSDALKTLRKSILSSHRSMSPEMKRQIANNFGLNSSNAYKDPSTFQTNPSPHSSETRAIKSPSPSGASTKGPSKNFFGEFLSDPSVPAVAAEEQMVEEEVRGQKVFDIPDLADIQNNQVSLWKIITTRYFITAYPRFFEER